MFYTGVAFLVRSKFNMAILNQNYRGVMIKGRNTEFVHLESEYQEE